MAERGEQVAYADLIDKVGSIGRYVQARAAHIQTWLTSIIPLDEAVEDATPPDRLLAEFQEGMAAGYRHIQAGCDLPRVYWLERIDQAFSNKSVVIVRGASGQGKSALAYRYLHDYGVGLWRFQIRRIENRQDALTIATALSGHAKSIGVPITVYLDVQPGERVWPELVRALGQLPLVRVLVTVREEDWRRASLSGAEVAFQDIALEFDEVEARLLYPGLTQRDRAARFLDFDEAWRRFGGEGPLLEFVYLVTQTQTLADRLRQQIQSLRDEVARGKFPPADMRLLAVTAFASFLGARIDAVQARRGLALPDLGRSVERLEREYLLRKVDGGQYLDGLHPLRSRLLVEYLCDGLSFDRAELARDCLGLIPPDDVEVFLLHLAATQSDAMPAMLRHLQGWIPPTWSALGGVFRALLWWGLRAYVDRCRPLIAEARSELGDGWWNCLDFDLAELLPGTGLAVWKQLGDLIPEANQRRFQAFLDRQPPKAAAFSEVRNWLEMLVVPPSAPVHETDWYAIAELSYWCGHWRLDAPTHLWLRMLPLDGALNSLSLESLARLLLGRWNLEGAVFSSWLNAHHEAIAARFRNETETARLEDQDGVVRAHFLVGWGSLAEEEQASGPGKRSLHAEAMRRVILLRGLFPERSGYGCQGYGHRIFPTDYDDTTKTTIRPENLPPDWAVEVNATALALAKWDERLPGWGAFVATSWSRRQAISELLHGLRNRSLTPPPQNFSVLREIHDVTH
ncbi:MAG: hypothetical protein Q8Q28_16215 [Pseudomonadota bacterium]|nr:hypothetical protein [Pseudomonadota bacterium]